MRGIVYVASPLKCNMGRTILPRATFLRVRGRPPASKFVMIRRLPAMTAEPRPDLLLRILPEFAGQSRTTKDDYVGVAHRNNRGSRIHQPLVRSAGKREDYARDGVRNTWF